MKIQTFDTTEEANKFIDTVVMEEGGQIQYTHDGKVAVFYDCTKDEYEQHVIDRTIEKVKQSLFNNQTSQVAADAEVETFKNEGGKSEDFDDAIKKQSAGRQGIKVLENKLKALEEWKVSNS